MNSHEGEAFMKRAAMSGFFVKWDGDGKREEVHCGDRWPGGGGSEVP